MKLKVNPYNLVHTCEASASTSARIRKRKFFLFLALVLASRFHMCEPGMLRYVRTRAVHRISNIRYSVTWLRFRIVITQANIRFRPNSGEYSKFETNRIVANIRYRPNSGEYSKFKTNRIVANIRYRPNSGEYLLPTE